MTNLLPHVREILTSSLNYAFISIYNMFPAKLLLYQSGNSEVISFAGVVFPRSQNVLKVFKISEVQGCTVAVEAITWGNIKKYLSLSPNTRELVTSSQSYYKFFPF